MGTRHLICVVSNKEYKVAQYGQWDGYPTGQGLNIVNFLTIPNNINLLKKALSKIRFLDPSNKDKEFVEAYNNNNAPEWPNELDLRTKEQVYWWETYQSRNIGSDILTNIITSKDKEIVLSNDLLFAGNSLFCEWAYVIDLDKNTFEIYNRVNQDQLTKEDRFQFTEIKDNNYEPVKILKSYSLNQLPDEKQLLELEL